MLMLNAIGQRVVKRLNKLYLSYTLATRVDGVEATESILKGEVRESAERIYTSSDTHTEEYLHTR